MKNKLSYIALIVFISLLSNVSNAATKAALPQCAVNNISANYTIEHPMHKSKLELTLIRAENKVAHHYPQTEITEAWEQNHQNQIKPTRYFDAHARAIEYQPTERVHGKIEKDWSYRYQLLSQSLIDKYGDNEQSFPTCDSQQALSVSLNKQRFDLVFLPNQKLVKEFSVFNNNNQLLERWELQSVVVDNKAVERFFSERLAYKSTDFADIGDDHTDPFLTQMVTVGFIEAGASGFYQAHENGEVSSIGHAHQHH